jgi:hypothetical protein
VQADLLRLRQQLAAFAAQFTDIAKALQIINKAVFQAQETVECLLEQESVDTLM